jgi:putative hydrolase of the HAD superfamily
VNESIHSIFFDFDGTLVFRQPDSFDVICAFCAEIGQPLNSSAERQGRRAAHQFFVDPVVREQSAGLSGDEFWRYFNQRMLEASGIQGNLDDLASRVSCRIEAIEHAYQCPQSILDTLTELRLRDYHLGLITNREHAARFYELLDKMRLRAHFDAIVVSGEVGFRKPEPGIFYAALERMGTTSDQALYVGDNYWADVVGARRAGVTPVLLDPHRLFPDADCLVLDRVDGLLACLPSCGILAP